MNPLPTPDFWAHTLGALALQISLVLVIAGVAPWFNRSARQRRAIWLAAFASLAVVTGYVVTGLDQHLATRLARQPSSPAFRVRGNLPPESSAGLPGLNLAELRTSAAAAKPVQVQSDEVPPAIWWPAWLWLAGAGAVGLRATLPRIWLTLAGRLTAATLPADGPLRIKELAARLGIHRTVRVFASPNLDGPIAFGLFRPAIGLPAGFWTEHERAEQDVMLAHELAHLARKDPLWLVLADFQAALLWWHPLVWWARRQFRTACEAAADESSLVVENGPAVLAGCLVALATRWQNRGVLGLLGMAGFRSGLGQRVERLLRLHAPGPDLRRPFLAPLLLGLGCAIVVGSAGVLPVLALPAQPHPQASLLAVVSQALARDPVAAPPALDAGPNTRAATETQTEPPVNAETARSLEAPLAHPLPDPLKRISTEPPMPVEPKPERKNESVLPLPTNALQTADVGKTNEVLLTRTYRFNLNPNALLKGLGPVAVDGATNLTGSEALRRLFTDAGLDFSRTNTSNAIPGVTGFSGPANGGATCFINERTQTLLVRATARELDVVEGIIELLNAAPPQVLLEAKFVEIIQQDGNALGFDWFLGEVLQNPRLKQEEAAPATLTGILTDPQLRAVVEALEKRGIENPNEARRDPLPQAGLLGHSAGEAGLRGDQLVWPGQQATNAGNIRVTAALGARWQGVLKDAQLRVVMRALEQRTGVDVLSAPKVTTLSGRQAQVQIAEIMTVLTGVNPAALQKPGAGKDAGAVPFTTAQIPVGPTLDITPEVAADGYSIRLTVIPMVTEFMGYDAAPKDGKVRVWENGKARLVDVPLPRFRVRQMTTTTTVGDGQTLVLGGLVTEETEKDRNGKPRKDGKRIRKQLLVFVTPTIVDPAGNPVHAETNRTPDPNATPPGLRP